MIVDALGIGGTYELKITRRYNNTAIQETIVEDGETRHETNQRAFSHLVNRGTFSRLADDEELNVDAINNTENKIAVQFWPNGHMGQSIIVPAGGKVTLPMLGRELRKLSADFTPVIEDSDPGKSKITVDARGNPINAWKSSAVVTTISGANAGQVPDSHAEYAGRFMLTVVKKDWDNSVPINLEQEETAIVQTAEVTDLQMVLAR